MKRINIFTLDIKRNLMFGSAEFQKNYHALLLKGYLLAIVSAFVVPLTEYKIQEIILSVWPDSFIALIASRVLPLAMGVYCLLDGLRLLRKPERAPESVKSSARLSVFFLLTMLISFFTVNYQIVFNRALPDAVITIFALVGLLCIVLLLLELIEYVIYILYDKIF